MGSSYLLAVDQSTQATKAILFDRAGKPVCRVTKPHRQIYPGSGLVEHDPLEILGNTKIALAEVAKESGVAFSEIASLSITNQRETVLAWDRDSGLPVCNALVWQDERGAGLCATLASGGFEGTIAEKTGLRLDPYFSASKLAWIVREVDGAKASLHASRLMCGTVDSWLIWNLTGRKVFATDYSNASRTMLFNIRTLSWDDELLSLFGLSGIILPEPRCSDSSFGEAAIPGFPSPLPIAGVMGDSHAALFGHRGWGEGDAKATYGTGSSIMSNVGAVPRVPPEGVVLSLAWGFRGKAEYVFEGNIHATGYTVRWLRDNLGLFADYAEAERLAVEAGDNGGVYVVPAFSGLGAPYWEHGIRALVTGLSHGSDRRHIVRAGLESIAYQIGDLVAAMDSRAATPLAVLHVDGGPTRNAFLMQFQADMLGIPVVVPAVEEISALGVAYMGGMAEGVWAGPEEVGGLAIDTKRYLPAMDADRRQALVALWHSAVAQAISRKVT
jgi:glycerol kinase